MGSHKPSQKRIEANRRNAQTSTGPRSAEGKTKSATNSTIHGFSSLNMNDTTTETIRLGEIFRISPIALCYFADPTTDEVFCCTFDKFKGYRGQYPTESLGCCPAQQ